MVRRRGGRKRALGTRAPMTVPQGPTSAGASTSCRMRSTTAGASRVLAVVDDFTRECLATVVDTSLSGHRVVRELGEIIEKARQALH